MKVQVEVVGMAPDSTDDRAKFLTEQAMYVARELMNWHHQSLNPRASSATPLLPVEQDHVELVTPIGTVKIKVD